MTPRNLKHFLFGRPLDPFKQDTRKHIALITFLAWIGLGADGISSSCYGPEEAFLALGTHTQLGIFLALLTGITVFLISTAYLQVIDLFPNGGGGYKVASTLLGARAGLVSGSALIVDYVLTIAISVASSVDALFSILPPVFLAYKLPAEIGLVLLLTHLNMRGMKESIKVLMPIFLGFIITHFVLIVYGITSHKQGLTEIFPEAIRETRSAASDIGWFALLALFFKAFSLGGGTYTGLEAVSNSLHNLAEPKVRTGKNTMLCVALSLAFTAAGITLLYLLWDVYHVPGETLNATAFRKITAGWEIGGVQVSPYVVGISMLFEAGLLFVAANTGFLAGPSVLANLAVDRWMPHLFSALSSRLVTKNGVLLMGSAAIGALLITQGAVSLLVVLYSINVFLTFTLSIAGLLVYRWRHRKENFRHRLKMIIPFFSFIVCASILITTLMEKFLTGGWITVLVTGVVILIGTLIKRHYVRVQHYIEKTEKELVKALDQDRGPVTEIPRIDHSKPTAVFLVSETNASGLRTFLWVQQAFPNVFENFVFVSVGEIDTEEFVNRGKWNQLRRDTRFMLKHYVDYCHSKGLSSTYFHAYGTDIVEKLTDLTDRIAQEFPNSTFFATRLISDNENFITQLLHNQTAYILQRRLHNKGRTMIIMPIKLEHTRLRQWMRQSRAVARK